MLFTKLSFAGLAVGASAATIPQADSMSAQAQSVATLLVGGGPTGVIGLAEFDGKSFKMVGNRTDAGTSASWQLMRNGTNQLYAVDENSSNLRLYNVNRQTNQFTSVQTARGSSGVVYLEFNKDRTRLAGAAYGAGKVDFWDVSGSDGKLKLLKTLAVPTDVSPDQDSPHPHQILLDPSGRFYLVNDLGTDRILVVDTQNDSFKITTSIKVPRTGAGPRHGAFYPPGAAKATHYVLVQETANLVQVFKLAYTDKTINLTPTQEISSFGDLKRFGPADPDSAAAGELQISADGADVYVSNRLTGNQTDSVAHFKTVVASNGDLKLEYRETVSSGGILPRMFSLGVGDFANYLFAVNQKGPLGLVAFRRNTDGSLAAQPVASVPSQVWASATSSDGPQFVQQVFL